MDRSRRLVLMSASAAVVLAGCGGGGDDSPAPAPGPVAGPAPTPAVGGATTLSCAQSVIEGNHGHVFASIAAADLDSATDKVYDIRGQSNHPHTITLTPAQLAQIKAGTAVEVESSEDASHRHKVTVTCG